MSVLLTLEDVTTYVQTMLDHSSVIVKLDTLLLAMDSHALVSTDCTILQLTLLQVYVFLPNSDVNECSTSNGGCHHVCTNSAGSFQCSCNSGYSLAADGTTCVDIDECRLNTDNCEQTCVNTVGGFTCSCNSGFTLNSDGRTCDGEITALITCM